jgi:tetratricopeptide (TPR) repeat protein/tRNA A-37 threonylcarbamoyl transferase component Bud32
MDARATTLGDRDEILGEALAEYLRSADSGRPPDRQAWLARYPDLAEELEAFLAAQDRLERLARPLRQVVEAIADGEPSTDASGEGTGPEQPGTPVPGQIADYEVLGELGRGGMGVVYRARQKGLKRLVALKVIRMRELVSADEARRFRAEAEMAAALDHPHVVPVHEVSEHEGQLFYSMRLMEGGSLAAQLERFRDDPHAAARLVATVARGVHHAHQRGILHRDLKPANILLDTEGQPHVSDFGLAKRVESDGSLTQTGAIVGTPQYMAPEQTQGQKGAVTTATDVYGLGAVLYALLTGKAPFRGDTVLETLEQVREREPASPRRSNAKVDRDLETICLKCLAKDPGRRYGSAEALAEDLERWLNGEPIQARRVGTGERIRKWVRRRPALAALAAVSALASLALVSGLLWHDARMKAAAEEARQERDIADEERRWARQAVDDMYTEVAEKWLARQPHLTPLERQLLEKAERYYQHAAEQTGSDPEVRRQAAKARSRLGALQFRLNRPDDAAESLRTAIVALEQLRADFPEEADFRYELGLSQERLGQALSLAGRAREAEEALQQGIGLLEELAAAFPERAEYRVQLAETQEKLAGVLERLGQGNAAEKMYQQAIEAQQNLRDEALADVQRCSALAFSQGSLAGLLVNSGRHREAEQPCLQALALLQKLPATARRMPSFRAQRSAWLNTLGATLSRTGRLAEAERAFRDALTVQEELAGDFPNVPECQAALAARYGNLGVVLKAMGRPDDAEKAYTRAIEILRQTAKDRPNVPLFRQNQAEFEYNLGNLLFHDPRRMADAESAYQRAIKLQTALVTELPRQPEPQNKLAWSYQSLGALYRTRGRPDEAVAAQLQARKVREKLVADFPHVAAYRKELADLCNKVATALLGLLDSRPPEPARALPLTQRAVELAPGNATYWYTLALAQYRAGDARASLAALEKESKLRAVGGYVWLLQALAHARLGERQVARKCYDNACRWAGEQKDLPETFGRLRAEAAGALGIKEQPARTPEPPREQKGSKDRPKLP